MTGRKVEYRIATEADLPGITHVRTSVRENHLSVEQLAERGITEASVAASFQADSAGWVAIYDGRVVGFSIADRAKQSVFALFVLPEFDKRGIGSCLLDLAVAWLWENGATRIWLETRKGTWAEETFYRRKGWIAVAVDAKSNVRFELEPPS